MDIKKSLNCLKGLKRSSDFFFFKNHVFFFNQVYVRASCLLFLDEIFPKVIFWWLLIY